MWRRGHPMTGNDSFTDIHGDAKKPEASRTALGDTAAGRDYQAPLGRPAGFVGDLADKLQSFDPALHGGEAMASGLVGAERF